MFTVGDLNNNLFSCFISRVTAVGASLIPGKSLVARIFSAAGGRVGGGGEWGRKIGREGWAGDENVLTTGNLVVLQLEFPFSPLVVFLFFFVFFFYLHSCPLRKSFCFGNKDAAVG